MITVNIPNGYNLLKQTLTQRVRAVLFEARVQNYHDHVSWAMVKDCCPSKHHFAKVVTQVEGRPDKITWKCDHCGKHVISGVFRAAYARIHLAAENSNGLCSNLCDSKDDHAHGRQMQFRKLIAELARKKKDKARKRKQQEARLEKREREIIIIASAKKKAKTQTQPKLKDFIKVNDAAAADYAVAQWAIAHDIAPNAMQGPYWRNMNKKLSKVAPTYSPMYPQKINRDMLPKLKKNTCTTVPPLAGLSLGMALLRKYR